MPIDFSQFWDFGDPNASEKRFRSLLEVPGAPARPDSERAEILTQLARAQGLQRRFDDARRTLAQAADLIADPLSRAALRLELELGRLANTSGDPAASVPRFTRAWTIARHLGDDALAVDAAHMLGIVEPGETGIQWNQRALELALASTDPAARRWTASLRNNIGWSLHDRGRFEQALAMFQDALAERVAATGPSARRALLIARWTVARCLRSLGRVDEAIAAQRSLLDEHARDGTADGFVHEELAECLLARGDAEAARPHFRHAHTLLAADPHLAATDPERLARLARLAASAAGRP